MEHNPSDYPYLIDIEATREEITEAIFKPEVLEDLKDEAGGDEDYLGVLIDELRRALDAFEDPENERVQTDWTISRIAVGKYREYRLAQARKLLSGDLDQPE